MAGQKKTMQEVLSFCEGFGQELDTELLVLFDPWINQKLSQQSLRFYFQPGRKTFQESWL